MPLVKATQGSRPFTLVDVQDRDLVVAMLRHEEALARSDAGQDRYRNVFNDPNRSLTVEKSFQRATLAAFGYDTSDAGVAAYRSIFRTYFHSPDSYDAGVIASSYYMRNNRCVFYTSQELAVGEVVPNVPLLHVDGSCTTLYEQLDPTQQSLVCAFSES